MAGATCATAETYLRLMSEQCGRIDAQAVDAYADLIFQAWREGRRVWLFGNGGSAYTASHHATDYVKTAAVEGRPRLQAFSLLDNVGLTTAIGNDLGYDQTFVYPLASYARGGDVAVAISCSGNSANVVRACEWAKANGLTLVALTGFTGGVIGPMADLHLHIPSDNYGVVEDLQMAVGHIAAQALQSRIRASGATS